MTGGSVCFECGGPAHEDHHIVPEIRGGKHTVPLCSPCHGKVHGVNRSISISELTKEGMRQARERGAQIGARPQIPADVVQEILRLRKQGVSLRGIADKLTLQGFPTVRGAAQWHNGTVRYVLSRLNNGG